MFIEVKLNIKIKNIFILILCIFCIIVLMLGKVDICIIEILNCYVKEFISIYLYV